MDHSNGIAALCAIHMINARVNVSYNPRHGFTVKRCVTALRCLRLHQLWWDLRDQEFGVSVCDIFDGPVTYLSEMSFHQWHFTPNTCTGIPPSVNTNDNNDRSFISNTIRFAQKVIYNCSVNSNPWHSQEVHLERRQFPSIDLSPLLMYKCS